MVQGRAILTMADQTVI